MAVPGVGRRRPRRRTLLPRSVDAAGAHHRRRKPLPGRPRRPPRHVGRRRRALRGSRQGRRERQTALHGAAPECRPNSRREARRRPGRGDARRQSDSARYRTREVHGGTTQLLPLPATKRRRRSGRTSSGASFDSSYPPHQGKIEPAVESRVGEEGRYAVEWTGEYDRQRSVIDAAEVRWDPEVTYSFTWDVRWGAGAPAYCSRGRRRVRRGRETVRDRRGGREPS